MLSREETWYQTDLTSMEEFFKSERYFTLFDFMISHGQLLIRSQKNDEAKHNIDIVFFGTVYLQCFAYLKGLRIRRLQNEKDIINHDPVRKYLNHSHNHLFEVKSENENYYIAASFVRVFENELEFSQSSLDPTNEGMGTEIATSL